MTHGNSNIKYYSIPNTCYNGFTCCMPLFSCTWHSRRLKILCKCLKSLTSKDFLYRHTPPPEPYNTTCRYFLYRALDLVNHRPYANSFLHLTLVLGNLIAVCKHYPALITCSEDFKSCIQILLYITFVLVDWKFVRECSPCKEFALLLLQIACNYSGSGDISYTPYFLLTVPLWGPKVH